MTPPRLLRVFPIVLCLGLFAWGSEAQAETVYVQAKTAQLRAGKTSLDAVVGNVKFGEALEVVGRDGNWVPYLASAGQSPFSILRFEVCLISAVCDRMVRKSRTTPPVLIEWRYRINYVHVVGEIRDDFYGN